MVVFNIWFVVFFVEDIFKLYVCFLKVCLIFSVLILLFSNVDVLCVLIYLMLVGDILVFLSVNLIVLVNLLVVLFGVVIWNVFDVEL